MSFRAKAKYRQITVSGDVSQRLHRDGVAKLANAFPYISGTIRQVTLDENFRQNGSLAHLSSCFRAFTESADEIPKDACGAPVFIYDDPETMADFIVSKVANIPGEASLVIIASRPDEVRKWFDIMASNLEGLFRNPIISDRHRLTERLRTHFTTPLEAKGLEFDVAVIPNVSAFSDTDLLELNALYVGVSRPRHAVLLGCERSMKSSHRVVRELTRLGHLVYGCVRKVFGPRLSTGVFVGSRTAAEAFARRALCPPRRPLGCLPQYPLHPPPLIQRERVVRTSMLRSRWPW